ncbi:MAG: NAD(P)/FAD-dependent oxidoreductase [Solirubrobacteraceae bacterium]
MNVDVAVIGAGVTGLSIAWHLGSERSVVLFDGAGIGAGASSIQPGGVRQQWGTRMSCELAIESFQFYSDLDRRLSPRVSPGLTQCGYLFVAESDEGLQQLGRNVELQNSIGIESRLVSPAQAGELVDGLDVTGISGAAWSQHDGYFDKPLAVVAAFYDAAERHGAVHVQQNVVGISGGPPWELRLADGTSATATTVVIAAAHGTAQLLDGVGVQAPITKEPRYLFYSEPIQQRLLEPLAVFVDRHFAAKQLADGSVLASDLTATGDPATEKSHWYSHIRESIRDRLPVLDYVSFPIMVEGFYDVTPDRQPIVGPVAGRKDLWLAAGLNGRGLMMAPAIGRLLSEAVLTGSLPHPLPALGLERFAVDQLHPEPQVV